MSKTKLKTAILGISDHNMLIFEAVAKADFLKIEAVADTNSELAQETAAFLNCTWYDDYRSLIVQNQFDCIIVAAPWHSCSKYVKDAIRKRSNVIAVTVPGRDFEEAVELVQLAKEHSVKFAVANPYRYAKGPLALYNAVTENQIEHTFLLTANCIIANAPLPAWRSDPKLAGGGVLMHECYKIIDLIVSCFGLPQQVYSLNVSNAPDRKQRLYLTEDTALLTMKFSDAFAGNLVAFRSDTTEPQKELIQVCGKNRTVTLSEKVFRITDETGRALDQFEFDSSGPEVVAEMFDSLAMNIISPDNNILQRPVAQDLNNMAVIEAAYLSARTGFPEEPAKILQMAKIEPQKSLTEQKTMRNPHLTSCSAPDNVSE